jgi:hypothetical protein
MDTTQVKEDAAMSFNVRARRWEEEWARYRRGEHADFDVLAHDVLEHRRWACRHMLLHAPALLGLLVVGSFCIVLGIGGVSAYLDGKTDAHWGLFLYCFNLVAAFFCGYQFSNMMFRFVRTLLRCRQLMIALALAQELQSERQKT